MFRHSSLGREVLSEVMNEEWHFSIDFDIFENVSIIEAPEFWHVPWIVFKKLLKPNNCNGPSFAKKASNDWDKIEFFYSIAV